MPKYHAFAFPEYYPGGGMDDYVGSFDTFAEAKAAALSSEQFGRWNVAVVDERSGGLLRTVEEEVS